MLKQIAKTIRALTIDAVELAGSGHPGMPMGCAEIGAYLFGEFLNFDPKQPRWPLRDRLILSAGHGSLWLYSCLHMAGYPITIEDLKRFRELHSNTPSHPDRNKTPGVETTTGLDGQGVGFAVGQALALKLGKIDAKVVVLAGDGDLMEGISYEACSLAGHLNLNNLILIYDSNRTTLDGYVEESFSENVPDRFEAQNWDVKEINGNELDQIRDALSPLRDQQNKPTLVIANTRIGYGSPTIGGTPAAHSGPLGKQETALTRARLGIEDEPFYVDPEVYAFFQTRARQGFDADKLQVPGDIEIFIDRIPIASPIAGRWASHQILQAIKAYIPCLIGGSADLSSSDGTWLEGSASVRPNYFEEKNIKYGLREFAMGCIAAGIAQTNLFLPFVGTFLAFVDYMRSAIRLTCLMKLRVVYQLTHDSIFIGHDGPTHQPIEQIASLRALPGLLVLRPADASEVKMSWIVALRYDGPSAIVLSRQPLPELPFKAAIEEMRKGAYIVRKEAADSISHLIIATGSEVHLAIEVAQKLGPHVRVVSMPSWELFEQQPAPYRRNLIKGDLKISIEAGIEQGWHKYIGDDGLAIALDCYGESGSPHELASHFGYSVEQVLKRIQAFQHEHRTLQVRHEIADIIDDIDPMDQLEEQHLLFVKDWIASGAELFRISKPATPETHLVSYFVLLDQEEQKLLLVDHKKSGLWLPAGGHVEPNEHPTDTVKREILEELGVKAEFLLPGPIFLTVAKTVGMTAGHTDVSLWYILKGKSGESMEYDEEEFFGVKWYAIDDIPYSVSDPHMQRFVQKLIRANIIVQDTSSKSSSTSEH